MKAVNTKADVLVLATTRTGDETHASPPNTGVTLCGFKVTEYPEGDADTCSCEWCKSTIEGIVRLFRR